MCNQLLGYCQPRGFQTSTEVITMYMKVTMLRLSCGHRAYSREIIKHLLKIICLSSFIVHLFAELFLLFKKF